MTGMCANQIHWLAFFLVYTNCSSCQISELYASTFEWCRPGFKSKSVWSQPPLHSKYSINGSKLPYQLLTYRYSTTNLHFTVG